MAFSLSPLAQCSKPQKDLTTLNTDVKMRGMSSLQKKDGKTPDTISHKFAASVEVTSKKPKETHASNEAVMELCRIESSKSQPHKTVGDYRLFGNI